MGTTDIVITDIDYTEFNNRPVVHIFGRSLIDRTIRYHIPVHGFRPRFYVSDHKSPSNIHNMEPTLLRTVDNFPVTRIFTVLPREVPNVRSYYANTYEADRQFKKVFKDEHKICTGISIAAATSSEYTSESISPIQINNYPSYFRWGMLDIEIDTRFTPPKFVGDVSSLAKHVPIVLISLHDNFTNTYYTFTWHPKYRERKLTTEWKEKFSDKNRNLIIDIARTESDMLMNVIRHIKSLDYDVLSGWFAKGFDFPYILTRMKALYLPVVELSSLGIVYMRTKEYKDSFKKRKFSTIDRDIIIRGRTVIDLQDLYMANTQYLERSYALDYISKKTLGYGKYPVETARIGEIWFNDLQEAIKYNVRDIELCVGINSVRKFSRYAAELCALTGCFMEDVLSKSRPITTVMIRLAHEFNYVLPTNLYNRKLTEKSYKGAIVLNPIPGVHRAIAIDFASLYPNCAIAGNYSIETLISKKKIENLKALCYIFNTKNPYEWYLRDCSRSPSGEYYDTSKDGIYKIALKRFLKERNNYKRLMKKEEKGSSNYESWDEIQYTHKVLANSFCSITGYESFLLFEPAIPSSITSTARFLLEETAKTAKKLWGFDVIYGDTDSCFIKIPDSISDDQLQTLAHLMCWSLNNHFYRICKKFNWEPHHFNIQYEKTLNPIILFPTKKKYVYLDENGNVAKKGMESVRSDSNLLQVRLLQRVERIILEGFRRKTPVEELENYVTDLLINVRKDVLHGKFTMTELGFPKMITKPIDKYATNAVHIRAVRYSNAHLGTNFGKRDKPMWIYIKKVPRGYPRTNVIAFDETTKIPAGFIPDYEQLLDVSTIQKVDKFFNVLGWDLTKVESDPFQKSLMGFLNDKYKNKKDRQ